jgi:anti-sigma factor RsiW
MREEHIVALLERDRFGDLPGIEQARITTHCELCEPCRQAYLAARAAADLLRTRAAEVVEPSPFFATRVMARIREEQQVPSVFDLSTLWQRARVLVFSAVAAVVLLAGMTFIGSQNQTGPMLSSGAYSTETVVFADQFPGLEENSSNELLMDVVFTGEESDAGN